MGNEYDDVFHQTQAEIRAQRAASAQAQQAAAKRAFEVAQRIEEEVANALQPQGLTRVFTPHAAILSNPAKRTFTLTTSEFGVRFSLQVLVGIPAGYSQPVHQMALGATVYRKKAEVKIDVPASLTPLGVFGFNAEGFKQSLKAAIAQLARMTA